MAVSVVLKISFVLLTAASISEAESLQCPPGQYWSRIQGSCHTCNKGFYQDKPGQNSCITCPKGHSCPEPKTRAIPCPPGTRSWGYYSDRLACKKCHTGNYQDKPGQTYCHDCPDGHSCPVPETRPIPCPPGTTNGRYEANRLICQKCKDGFYQDKQGQPYCHPCPDGHSCPTPRTRAIPCPPGTRSSEYILNRRTCLNCSDGYYQDKPGQSECLPCPVGRYCPPSKNRAIPCPAGTISTVCSTCSYERAKCPACLDGYYQDKIGQHKCLLCPEGRKCPAPKKRSVPCPPGYKNSYYRFSNWFSNRTLVKNLVNCLACKAGYYQNRPEQTHCNLCPIGHYCPQKENGPVPCPPGFTNSSMESGRISCARCSEGECLSPVTPPVVCSPGMYLHSGTGTCKSCETGMYQADSGQSSCKICPEGFYCPNATGKPIPCPSGTYSTKEMGLRTACLNCSVGTYQVQQGQNLCLECPAGHYCPRPNFDPVPCPVGTYATSETTDRTNCLPCSSQQYQDQNGQQNCKPCPAGYFCMSPDLSPQQCPPNTYSNDDVMDRSKCLPCHSGQYQDECGQEKCKALFPDGTSPSIKPGLTCRNLNKSEIVADHLTGCYVSHSAYSGAIVQNVEGNNGILYPLVDILPEHLAHTKVVDNRMKVSTATAFDEMARAAKTENVTILINSGFRTYERQEYLLNCSRSRNCNESNLATRTVPGTSRHGTGDALDLNTDCGAQTGMQPTPECANGPVYEWLKNNAHKFGFVRTIKAEPWHWEFQGGASAGPSNFT